mmetsp:Transcript_49402/g.158987  ORF Transcript_49402/g.158987 Transcript_49402/m.158987 type:complete len:204 (+) Transcript_49402:254-865(+)
MEWNDGPTAAFSTAVQQVMQPQLQQLDQLQWFVQQQYHLSQQLQQQQAALSQDVQALSGHWVRQDMRRASARRPQRPERQASRQGSEWATPRTPSSVAQDLGDSDASGRTAAAWETARAARVNMEQHIRNRRLRAWSFSVSERPAWKLLPTGRPPFRWRPRPRQLRGRPMLRRRMRGQSWQLLNRMRYQPRRHSRLWCGRRKL